jgi:hypothetical protein
LIHLWIHVLANEEAGTANLANLTNLEDGQVLALKDYVLELRGDK